MHEFLPVTAQEMKDRGWEQVDFVYLTGDAYVDHPSFGMRHYQQASGKPTATGLGSFLSLTGGRKKVSRCSGNRAWVFL